MPGDQPIRHDSRAAAQNVANMVKLAHTCHEVARCVALDGGRWLCSGRLSRKRGTVEPEEDFLTALVERFGQQLIATAAKILASAIFVSGRSIDEAIANSVPLSPDHAGRDPLYAVEVDEIRREVTLTLNNGVSRTARYLGDQGCTIIDPNKELGFEPTSVESDLGDAASTPWPMGDVVGASIAESPTGSVSPLRLERLDRALDLAFADEQDHTAAFVVVHRGELVAERYGPGIDQNTQLESWSMGKTITAALIGRLIQQGVFSLEDAAPVGAWQAEGDSRSDIRIRDLLQMSSGLACSSAETPFDWFDIGYPDHVRIYTGEVDVFEFATSMPAEFPPQTVGRYRNCDPLVLGFLVKQEAERRGEPYLTFPQRELFDHLGIRQQVLETDVNGNFILTGFDYGTARNWARLGLLFAQDGVFEGKRLLPEGFCEFVRTPAPAWEEPQYGGQCWLNGVGQWPLSAETMIMAGTGGQNVFVDHANELVIVRMGHRAGMATYAKNLSAAQALIVEAIEAQNELRPAG